MDDDKIRDVIGKYLLLPLLMLMLLIAIVATLTGLVVGVHWLLVAIDAFTSAHG